MSSSVAIENAAGFSRATCGWRLAGLALADVWRYWRDVHGPAIARRAGIHIYRHYRWLPVRAGLLGTLPGIETAAPDDAQLQWLSDILYRDQAALDAFYHSPSAPEVVSKILGDIEMIVDRSTTYLTLAGNMATYAGEESVDPVRQGDPPIPHFGLFFRRRGASEHDFRLALREVARAWAAEDGVRRLRLNLFEAPDMEADSKAGYPVKTHPVAQQYQAWIDLVVDGDVPALLAPALVERTPAIGTVHAYPVAAVYTLVWDGAPTLVGLRGYPAYRAIEALGAEHAKDRALLRWMYGPVVDGAAAGALAEGAAS